MEQLLLVVYVLLAAAMVALILFQQGKGADMGASFGSGASQTLFGAAGSGNVLTRATAILATLFFVASIGLGVMAKHKAEAARTAGIPVPAAVEKRELPALPGPDDLPPAAPSATPAAADAPAADAAQAPAAEVPVAQAPAAASDELPAPVPAQ